MAKIRVKMQKVMFKVITKLLGDIPEAATYSSLDTDYDTNTSSVSNNTEPVEVAIKAIFVKNKNQLQILQKLLQGTQVEPQEMQGPTLKAIVSAKQLADGGVTPKVNDTIERGVDLFTIDKVEVDPLQSVYSFTLSQP